MIRKKDLTAAPVCETRPLLAVRPSSSSPRALTMTTIASFIQRNLPIPLESFPNSNGLPKTYRIVRFKHGIGILYSGIPVAVKLSNGRSYVIDCISSRSILRNINKFDPSYNLLLDQDFEYIWECLYAGRKIPQRVFRIVPTQLEYGCGFRFPSRKT